MDPLDDRLRALGLSLSEAQLTDMRTSLRARCQQGMGAPGREIAMLPAWLAPPAEGLSGSAIAVDAGGTHLRAARIEWRRGEPGRLVSPIASTSLPGAAGKPAVDSPAFFDAHVEVLSQVGARDGDRVGYCFSYPITCRPDGDAILNTWTKEVRVRGVVGNGVGRMLREHAAKRGLQLGRVVVLNDTIATLVGGSLAPGVIPERNVGLIVGTGTNIGAWLPSADLTKLPADEPELLAPYPQMAVNFESGAFAPPGLGPVDEIMDESSQNPKAQRFEKAVSGAYLGRVFHAACRELNLDHEGCDEPSAAEVSAFAAAPGDAPEGRLARALLERSGSMVAASLAATYDLMGAATSDDQGSGQEGARDLYVTAEGSLFWKAPGYVEHVTKTLDAMLAPSGAKAHIRHVNNANLLGSTAAVLGKT